MFSLTFTDGEPASQDPYSQSSQHMTTARKRARRIAAETDRLVLISVTGKVRTIIRPDGTATAPNGMLTPERVECQKANGRPCFCAGCREDRRASRNTRIAPQALPSGPV